MAGPIDFAVALQRKYDILQQQANATAQLKTAQSNQLNVQTELAPDLAQATIARQGSAASADDARAGFLGAQSKALGSSLQALGMDPAEFAYRLQGGGRGATRRKANPVRVDNSNPLTRYGSKSNSGGSYMQTMTASPRDAEALKRAQKLRQLKSGL